MNARWCANEDWLPMMDQVRLGRVYVSVGVKAVLSRSELSTLLTRHVAGERRVGRTGPQVVSEFWERSSRGRSVTVWVVTEPKGPQTTMLLPCETRYRDGDIEFDRTDGVTAEEIPALSQNRFADRPSPNRQSRAEPLQSSQTAHPSGALQPRSAPQPETSGDTRPVPSAPRTDSPEQRTGAQRPTDSGRERRDDAYWDTTAALLLDYFELLAGPDCCALVAGFADWLKRSRDAHHQYVEGDDMDRARLVERYVRIHNLPRA